jgi:membrane associated rhomboid family serine protease
LDNDEKRGLLDQVVENLANLLDAVGVNTRRLRWKWERKRIQLREVKLNREVLLRSAKGKHKMCPACRALIDRSSSDCPDCGEPLGRVKGPGAGRLVTNLLPGVTAATSLIMLVNGFWFAMMLMAQIKSGTGGFSFDPEMLVRFGSGLSWRAELNDGTITGSEWWRIVTPIFLHGGILHFGMNSYMLLQLGRMVEDRFGTERFWVIYLGCGLAGSLLTQSVQYVNTVGASGAIFGLMGFLLIYNWRFGGIFGDVKNLLFRLAFFMIILSFMFNLDHWNHGGGVAMGMLFGALLPSHHRPPGPAAAAAWKILSVAGVLLVLLCFYKVSTVGKLT